MMKKKREKSIQDKGSNGIVADQKSGSSFLSGGTITICLFVLQAVFIVGFMSRRDGGGQMGSVIFGEPCANTQQMQQPGSVATGVEQSATNVNPRDNGAPIPQSPELKRALSSGGLRVGILSITTEYDDANKYEKDKDYLEQLLVNRECYSAIHGYDNLFFTEDFVKDLKMPKGPTTPPHCRFVCSNEPLEFTVDRIPPHWNKVWGLKHLLKDYDYLLWTDADVFITNLAMPVDHLVNKAKIRGADGHIWLPQDQGGAGEYMFSDAVFLVKNSKWGQIAMDDWWDYGTGLKESCKGRFFRTQQTGHDMNLDMPWMWHSMVLLYDKYHGKHAPCLDECANRTIANCFREYMRHERYPISHEGIRAERIQGPIVFSSLQKQSPYETGIMLQGNWGPYQDDQHVDAAYTIHSKKGRDPHKHYLEKMHYMCEKFLGCKAETSRDAEAGKVNFKVTCEFDGDKTKTGTLRRRLSEIASEILGDREGTVEDILFR